MDEHSKRKSPRRRSDYGDSYNYSDKAGAPHRRPRKKKRKKRSGRTRNIRNTSIIVLCVLAIAIGAVLIYAHKTLNSVKYVPLDDDQDITFVQESDSSSIEPISLDFDSGRLLSDPMVLNVLLLGSDSYSAGDDGRTDTIMLMSIDNRHKKLKVTSFLRDLWVKIPGYGENRLNAAYAIGGPKLTIETIERNFGISIDRYAVADFPGFEAIVNRLGGIELELTDDECEYLNTHCDDPNKLYGAGLKKLSGTQALNHARNRDSIMSDFDRTTRQRDVVTAIVSKLKGANLAQITGIISDVGPMITTNLKKNEIAALAKNSLTYINYPMEEFSLPELDNFSDEIIEEAWVLALSDMHRARLELAQFIFEESVKTRESSSSKKTSNH